MVGGPLWAGCVLALCGARRGRCGFASRQENHHGDSAGRRAALSCMRTKSMIALGPSLPVCYRACRLARSWCQTRPNTSPLRCPVLCCVVLCCAGAVSCCAVRPSQVKLSVRDRLKDSPNGKYGEQKRNMSASQTRPAGRNGPSTHKGRGREPAALAARVWPGGTSGKGAPSNQLACPGRCTECTTQINDSARLVWLPTSRGPFCWGAGTRHVPRGVQVDAKPHMTISYMICTRCIARPAPSRGRCHLSLPCAMRTRSVRGGHQPDPAG